MGGLRGWGRGQNLTFSEYGHIAYQIKADDAGSNMVANILPTDTPLTQGMGSKGQTMYFSESSHAAYQIKADVSIFFIKLSTKTYLTGICYDLNDTEGELMVR